MKTKSNSFHTPGPWKAYGTSAGKHYVGTPHQGTSHFVIADVMPAKRETLYNSLLIAAAPDLLAALQGCLAQLEGPIMVYGDGRGNDGTKSDLSHAEFNDLRNQRLANAREAIAKAKGQKS